MIIAINAFSRTLLRSCLHSAVLAICYSELRDPVIDNDVFNLTNVQISLSNKDLDSVYMST